MERSEAMGDRVRSNDDKVRLEPLKKDADSLIDAVEGGDMVAILSKAEIMYTYFKYGQYFCYIHPIGEDEGRCKAFPKSDETKAIIKNLAHLSDQLFRIVYKKNMDPMGVMVAAENGILSYLNMTGQMPGEDVDFMDWHGEEEDEK
jgi:hypothetical protein